jgi:hypothetical protein
VDDSLARIVDPCGENPKLTRRIDEDRGSLSVRRRLDRSVGERRDAVVCYRIGKIGTPDRIAVPDNAAESASVQVMYEVAVYVEEIGGTAEVRHYVRVPDPVEQRLARG